MRRALLLVALFTGCSFDTTVPDGARITCRDDRECPRGLRCQPAAGYCVKEADFDPTPPEVVLTSVTARIVPGPGNLHPAPRALTVGSALRISFSTSEALRESPVLTPSVSLSCYPRAIGTADFEQGCMLPEGYAGPQVAVSFTAALVDVAGNRAEQALPVTVTIDTLDPPAPDVATRGAVVFARAPWGSVARGSTPRFTLEGQAASATEADYVAARSPGPVSRGLIEVRADGDFGPGDLVPVDDPVLEVASVDPAGNRSAFVKVHDGRWVASLYGRRAGDDTFNPHRIGAVGAQGSVPRRSDLVEWSEADGVAVQGGAAAVVQGAATWRQLGDPLPASFGQPVAVYDAERGRVVRFGGVQRQTVVVDFPSPNTVLEVGPPLGLGDAREWAGTGWVPTRATDPESDGRPAGRSYAAAAWSEKTGEVIIHGGQAPDPVAGTPDPTAGPVLSDTWAWNGTSWRHLAEGPALTGAVAFFDPAVGLVLAGGQGADGGLGTSTWTFDGVWSQLDAGALPARAFSAATWDSRAGAAWIFGGRLPDAGLSSELFRWTGQSFSAVATDGGPTARSHAAMIFDAERQRALLIGGRGRDGGPLLDSWAFDGANWAALPASLAGAVNDGGGNDPALAWDVVRNTAVLTLGRRTFTLDPADTDRWVERSANEPTAASYYPPLVCAPQLKGCRQLVPNPFRAPRLTPTGWVAASDLNGANSPSAWAQLGVAWNTPAQELVAARFEGNVSWRWRSDAGWETTPGPFAFGRGSTMTMTARGPMIAATRRAVMQSWLGDAGWADAGLGQNPPNLNDAGLELDWAAVVPTATGLEVHGLQVTASNGINGCANIGGDCPFPGPAARTIGARWVEPATGTVWPYFSDLAQLSAVGAVSWDPTRASSMIFGGMTLGSDKPEATLLEVQPLGGRVAALSNADGFGSPPGRMAASMQYSTDLRGHVLVGGTSSAIDWTYWSLRLPQWSLNELVLRYIGCGGNQTCFNAVADEHLTPADLTDTWLLSRETERPAALAAFDLSASKLPAAAPVTRLSVRAAVGASGKTPAMPYTAQDGARLMIWRAHRWEELARASAPVSAPASLNASAANTTTVEQLQSLGAKLHVALEPLGVNGDAAASLSVDELELELSYTLP
jgi:hypothetical protein